MVAVFAAVVSAAGAARPSLWFDEAATISASTNRSLTELWRLLDNIDAVHGLYYFVMHGWFAIFPATEFWSRLSSCLAVGGAAAGVVVLGKQLSTRSVAVTVPESRSRSFRGSRGPASRPARMRCRRWPRSG